MNITLFEIHLDDSTFSSTIGRTESESEPEEREVRLADEEPEPEDDEGLGLALLVPVVVVLGVVAGVLAAWKLRGDDEEADLSEEFGEPVEIDA